MNFDKKVSLSDFLFLLDYSTVVKIWILNPDNCSIEHFIQSEVRFISSTFTRSFFVKYVSLVNELPFTDPTLHIYVSYDDLPF